jgi:CubicO group peptidase (beta-lactamase class C family)
MTGSRLLALASLSCLGAAGAPAQTYDFSAATRLLEDNVGLYPGGVFVQVFQDDREIFVFRTGGVDADTRLRMASATKWLSSAVISRLVEDGRLGLDERLGDRLPVFDLYGKGDVTVRQCFAMTSGLHETVEEFETAPLLTLAQSASLVAQQSPLVFAPGTRLDYEGDGMQSAGRLAEVASGLDWRTLAAAELGGPLGLASLGYDLFPVNPGVPGGARLTPANYQRFLRMVLFGGRASDGSRYLDAGTAELWFTDATLGLPEFYSAWPPYPYPYGERPDYGHGAWILARNPETGLVEEVASPGKFGTFPWVDRRRRLRGVIATDSPSGFAAAVYVDLALLDALRAAVDAVLVFVDGFESGGAAAWSATAGGAGPAGRPARRPGS